MRADPCEAARTEGAPRPAPVLLLGTDASLGSLLSDVLGEAGLTVYTEDPGGERPGAVLVMVPRGGNILSTLQCVQDAFGPAPVFILVPFADGRLTQLALRLGAHGCFALGQPMEELRRMVLTGMLGEAGERP
jgi:hypothetical protein